MRWSILLAALLAVEPGLVGAATPGSFVGEGSARIVGGNLVSARRRALSLAQQAALQAAVVSWGLTLDAAQLRLLGARAAWLLRNYSVLEERRDGQSYRLRVEARFDRARVRRVTTAAGTAKRAPAIDAPPTLVALQLVVRGLEVARAGGVVAKALGSLLSSRGLVLGTPAATRVAALGAAQGRYLASQGRRGPYLASQGRRGPYLASQGRRGPRGLFIVTLETVQAPGVRGLALPGGRAKLELQVEAIGGGALARRSVSRWGRGRTVGDAVAQAVKRAVGSAFDASLLASLEARWRAVPHGAGESVLRVGGLQSPQQYQELRALLASRGVPLRLRRLQGDHVTLLVSGIDEVKLLRLLTAHAFRGFSLVQQPAGAGVELRVRPALEPAGPARTP